MKKRKTLERYGTALRCYDNGGKTADRYTIVPPRWARRQHGQGFGAHGWPCISADESPFQPQGIGQHTSCQPGPHLGKRIHWDELPADVQRFARQAFPEYSPQPELLP